MALAWYAMGVVWRTLTLGLLLLVELARVLTVGGVAPHPTLALLVAWGVRRVPPIVFGGAVAGFLVLGFFWMPFWRLEVGMTAAVAVLSYLAVRHLTGNEWVDGVVLAAGSSVVYGGAAWALGGAGPSWGILGEAVYNALIALLFIAAARGAKKCLSPR